MFLFRGERKKLKHYSQRALAVRALGQVDKATYVALGKVTWLCPSQVGKESSCWDNGAGSVGSVAAREPSVTRCRTHPEKGPSKSGGIPFCLLYFSQLCQHERIRAVVVASEGGAQSIAPRILFSNCPNTRCGFPPNTPLRPIPNSDHTMVRAGVGRESSVRSGYSMIL